MNRPLRSPWSPPDRDPDPPWPPRPGEWRHDAGEPEEAFPVPFTVFDALAMVVWTFLSQYLVAGTALATGVVEVGADLASEPVTGLTLQIVGQLVTMVGLVGYLLARGVLSWRVLGPIRPRWRHVGIGVGLGLVGLLLVLTTSEFVNRSFGPFQEPQQFALQVSATSTLVLLLAGVSAVVLAPVVEETIFRSLLFQSIRRKLGMVPAIVLQSLVFAYIHFEVLDSPPAIIGLVVLALWLAASFHRVGSLVVPVTAHATYNASVLLIQAVFVAPSS